MVLLCEYISPTGEDTGQGWPLEEAAAPLDMHFSIPREQVNVAEYLLLCFLTCILCCTCPLSCPCDARLTLTSLPFASMPGAARLPRLPRLSNEQTNLPIPQQNLSISLKTPLT